MAKTSLNREEFSSIRFFEEIQHEPVGGKATGLKLLKQLSLRVPDGFVIIHPQKGKITQGFLEPFLNKLGDGPKAVRSSAVSEDGKLASFAGQFESYLNVCSIDEVIRAIHQCLDQSTGQRVQEYSKNISADADLRISVIVQNMVPATVAGVIFSADPVTHRRDKLVVNAVEGLGDNLVSGKEDAHHYEVFRSGSNITQAIRSDGHLLTVEHMKELIGGAKLAEQHMGQPVDLEWAIDETGQIFWLQARPVTALSEIHYNELDTIRGESSDIWTLGNIGEMMPGVTTPLTYSTIVDSIDYGMTVLADKAGAYKLKQRDGYLYIQMFYNRLFINLTHMMDYARYSWLNKSENIQLALSVKVNPAIRETEKALLPIRIYNFIRQSTAVIRATSYLKKLKTLSAGFYLNTNLPTDELYLHLGVAKHSVSLAFGHHLITSGQSGTLYSAFMGIMTDDNRLPDAEDHHIATILLSDIPDIESANAVQSLEYFSQLIRKYPEFACLFETSSPEQALRLINQESPPEIMQRYVEFIRRHGHRCVRESELREKPWEENQLHLIQLLQTKVRFGDVQHRVLNVREEINKTLKKLPFHKRVIFKILLPTARKAVARREISKALTIRMVNELRKGYRALSEKMTADHLFDDTDQIYFLTHQEIGMLLETGDRNLLLKANRRRELLPETDKLQFDEVCFGIPEPIEHTKIPDITNDQLQGTPVSCGKIKARVRIIETLEDAHLLEKGEIMVASFTDIGWSPYFSIISGLITEIGSPLSHGAVVAREYGIPAIVGAKGVKSFVKTGDMVLLDGDKGIVGRL